MAEPVEAEGFIESEAFSLRFRRQFLLSWEPEVAWVLNTPLTQLQLPTVAMVALPPSTILLVVPQEVRAASALSPTP